MADRKSATARHVALLRGINVGRAKRVAMADLRALFEELGYHDVQTLLNSGNVIFGGVRGASSAAAGRIETALETQFGFAVRVTVVSASELATIVTEYPFGDIAHDPSRTLVTFLMRAADVKRLAPLVAQEWVPEALQLGSRAAYLWCPDGILASRSPEAVNRILGNAVTARNWATVLKLHTLAQART